MCAAHTHADTHAHHCIARPRVSVCLFAFEGCDKSTKGQDFDLIPCTRPDANNTSKGKILVNLSRSPGQYAYSPQPHTLRLPILSKPRVPALTWYSCRTKMRWISRVCARCPHRCVLYAKDMARAVCCRLDTAMRSQDQVRLPCSLSSPKPSLVNFAFVAPCFFLLKTC